MTINQDENSQAAKLQQLFSEVTERERELENVILEDVAEVDRQIDILNLPPRSEVHTASRNKVKVTFNWPFIRLFIIMIILIVIVVSAYYTIGINHFL